jgi:hypothetical protein
MPTKLGFPMPSEMPGIAKTLRSEGIKMLISTDVIALRIVEDLESALEQFSGIYEGLK